MMNNFERCMEMLLAHEGGFTADKRDKGNANGGSTNLGVTSAVWADWTGTEAGIDVMKALTPETVSPLYRHNYWNRVKGDNLPSGVDWFLFDLVSSWANLIAVHAHIIPHQSNPTLAVPATTSLPVQPIARP